jgi:hypothetical protein
LELDKSHTAARQKRRIVKMREQRLADMRARDGDGEGASGLISRFLGTDKK